MKKRSKKKVESDFRRIKNYVETHDVKSLNEISKALNLTISQVNTSLSRHASAAKIIRQTILRNVGASKNNRQDENNVSDTSIEGKVCYESVDSSDEGSSNNFLQECNRFVIDASITGTEELFENLNKFVSNGGKFVLTSVTIKELDKMQQYCDNDGIDARRIMALAADNEQEFECVLIDETFETPDDCIIQYCATNKDGVTLLTSDKAMCLKARSLGVKTMFFKQNNHVNSRNEKREYRPKYRHTLYDAKMHGNVLTLEKFRSPIKRIRMISDGIEYNYGPKNLKVGDEIFIATKKEDYVTFAHYRMVSLQKENHCICVYGKRIQIQEDIEKLPRGSYRAFMREFTYDVKL